MGFSCGSIYLEFYFFYRSAQKYPEENIDISHIKNTLDTFGGIKLYRDNFLVRLQRSDWLGLDEMRVQDPGMYPGTDQIFGYVKITKRDNPLIKDTTNREGLIDNRAYVDMISFLRKSIEIFKLFRKQAEYKDGTRKKKPIKDQIKTVKKVIKKKKSIKKATQETFIDFGKKYPQVFYLNLEDEINNCYISGFPNATLLLCRKIIENLLYNILEEKFKKYPDGLKIYWNTDPQINQPHSFSRLIKNIWNERKRFKLNNTRYIERSYPLLKKLRNESNPKAHNVYDYLDSREDLKPFKMNDLVQFLLNIYNNI